MTTPSIPQTLPEDGYRAVFWRLAKILNCLPSTFPDANDHVIRAAERYVGLACKMCNGHGLVGGMTIEGGEGHECPDCHGTGAALAAQPPAVAAIPEGWALKPLEPTKEMLESAGSILEPYAAKLVWMRMNLAVPQPPAGQQPTYSKSEVKRLATHMGWEPKGGQQDRGEVVEVRGHKFLVVDLPANFFEAAPATAGEATAAQGAKNGQ